MDEQQTQQMSETEAVPKKNSYAFFAILSDVGKDGVPVLLRAQTKSKLKAMVSECDASCYVVAVLRGYEVKFQKKTAINFC
jgi:hypothetical protein